MNGRDLTLGIVAGLAVAGAVRGSTRHGSRAARCADLASIQRAIREEDEDFLLLQNPHDGKVGVTLGHIYQWGGNWNRVSEMDAVWVFSATHALCNFLDTLCFPLVLYRGLLRDAGSTVRFQGEHWTTDPSVARAFADGTHKSQIDYGFDIKEQDARSAPAGAIAEKKEGIVFVGLLRRPDSVNWDEVHQNFFLFSIDFEGGWVAEEDPQKTEREVQLHKGSLVEILEVQRFRAPARKGRRWLSDSHMGKQ